MNIHHLLSLIKPRIVALLCLTGLFSLFGAGGSSIAGALIAGSAAALNCWYDQDLDAIMERTQDRPLATGELPSRIGFFVGICLFLIGSVIGLVLLPMVTVIFMWLGAVAYLGVYTIGLKRRHWLGVVLGGSAGSFPVLAGWATVQPISLPAILMALLVFAWTPAHAWALAIVYRDDFERGDIPTYPVVSSRVETRDAILLSVCSTVAIAILAATFVNPVGQIALVIGTIGYVFGYREYLMHMTKSSAVRAFFTSNVFLALVFIGWGIGGLVANTLGILPWGMGIFIALSFYLVWRSQPELRGIPATNDTLI
ncbi:MAG: protoheme IX farnesyltransferase, partial [Halobacteriaceae archaeon]